MSEEPERGDPDLSSLAARREVVARDALWVSCDADVGAVRRRAAALARELALDIGAVALSATELATNLVEHSGGGFMQFFVDRGAIELLSVDFGSPGSPHASGLSAGLSIIASNTSVMEIDGSSEGAVVRCRFGAAPAHHDLALGVAMAPLRGYAASGDGVFFLATSRGWTAVVVDVLGHGPAAAAERNAIMEALRACTVDDPAAVLSALESTCRGGRGAAVRWASHEGDALRTFGIGNVTGSMLRSSGAERLDERPGIVGRGSLSPDVRTYAWGLKSRLVLFTDGLSARRVRARADTSAALEAGRLVRMAARERDDAAVLVIGGGG